MREFIWILVAGIAFGVLMAGMMIRSEKQECKQWQEDAAKFEGFYITQWQADQCTAHGITINAPVK